MIIAKVISQCKNLADIILNESIFRKLGHYVNMIDI